MQDRKLRSILSFKKQNNKFMKYIFHNIENMNICQKCKTVAFPERHTSRGPKLHVLSLSVMCGSGIKTRLRSQPGWVVVSPSRLHFSSVSQVYPSPSPSQGLVISLLGQAFQGQKTSVSYSVPSPEGLRWEHPYGARSRSLSLCSPNYSFNITSSTSRKIGYK